MDRLNARVLSTRMSAVLVAASLIVISSGCRERKIHAYRVPHEDDVASASSPQATQPTPQEQHVDWTVPTNWTEVETTVQMRVATFQTKQGLEVAVNAFPGDVGGLLANVNRWRGQVGLGPTEAAELESMIDTLDEGRVIIVDLSGEQNRLVGAIIDVGDGKTWFVKGMGAADLVEAAKDDLIAFARSFELHGASAAPSETAGPPVGTSDSPDGAAASEADAVRAQWRPPSQWKEDPNASQILSAAFLADDGARITLTALGGDGGGLLGNINRWRGQVGLDPVDSLEQANLEDLGSGGVLVDIPSEDGSSRIVAGIIPMNDQTLFFKLTGTRDQVESELDRFRSFVLQVGLGKGG